MEGERATEGELPACLPALPCLTRCGVRSDDNSEALVLFVWQLDFCLSVCLSASVCLCVGVSPLPIDERMNGEIGVRCVYVSVLTD